MSATRPSRRARQKDRDIHAALVSGLSPEQVATRMGLAVEQVRAAEYRVRDARAKLDPREADILEQRDRLDAIYQVAMESFQRSATGESVGTKASRDAAGKTKVERTTKSNTATPQFLRVALASTVHKTKLLGLDGPPPDPPPAEMALRESQEEIHRQVANHPDLAENAIHSMHELLSGRTLPRTAAPPTPTMPAPVAATRQSAGVAPESANPETRAFAPSPRYSGERVGVRGLEDGQTNETNAPARVLANGGYEDEEPAEDATPSRVLANGGYEELARVYDERCTIRSARGVPCDPRPPLVWPPQGPTITSNTFEDGEEIPTYHTGEGENASPHLKWWNLPDGTQELALICEDLDENAGTAARPEPWVHWVVYNIPPQIGELPSRIFQIPRPMHPAGISQGNNSWPHNNAGYRGPYPPICGGPHRYRFRLYALDTKLRLPPHTTDKAALLAAMHGHILTVIEYLGTYER